MADDRLRAVEAYMKALRTGESSAGAQAGTFLANDVVLNSVGAHMWGNGPEEFRGHNNVLRMITGIGVMTALYRGAGWSAPQVEGDKVKVAAELGGLIASTTLTFTFNEANQISHVEHINAPGTPAPMTDRMPEFVQAMVNSTYTGNSVPMIVAYTSEAGAPVLSMRGSTQVYSDHQLSIWVRHANGSMASAIKKNPNMTLMLQNMPARTMLTFEGRGHFEPDEEVRTRVFDLMPEVEQAHDPGHTGAALIIDINRVSGLTPRGSVRMERK